MYPPELQATKESITTFQTSFLDLSIIIENKKFKIGLFDKRNAFPFSIARMPHFDSNTPSNVYHASIASEILRFAVTTFDSNTFITLANQL